MHTLAIKKLNIWWNILCLLKKCTDFTKGWVFVFKKTFAAVLTQSSWYSCILNCFLLKLQKRSHLQQIVDENSKQDYLVHISSLPLMHSSYCIYVSHNITFSPAGTPRDRFWPSSSFGFLLLLPKNIRQDWWRVNVCSNGKDRYFLCFHSVRWFPYALKWNFFVW